MRFDPTARLQEVTTADEGDQFHLARIKGIEVLDHIGHLAPVDAAGLVVVGEVEDHSLQRKEAGERSGYFRSTNIQGLNRMKLNEKHLAVMNVMTFLAFSGYSIALIPTCTAYFMHDASIDTDPYLLVTISAILFLFPALVQCMVFRLDMPSYGVLHRTHFAVCSGSIGLLAIAVGGSCSLINNGHYMFIGFAPIVLSYSLRVVGFCTLLAILYRFGKDLSERRKAAS